MAMKSTEMASSLDQGVCEEEREAHEETSDSRPSGRDTLVESIDGLSHDTYLPEAVEALKEELAAAKQHAATLLEERADKESVLIVYQQAIFQREALIQQMAIELIGSDVKESMDDLEAIVQQSCAKIEQERLEKREREAVRERKDKETEIEISELKKAILSIEQRAEESYTQMTTEVREKLETGEWITAEGLVKERALTAEVREELERKSNMVSQLDMFLELEKCARVKEIEMFMDLLHNKEDEEVQLENKLQKLKKGVTEQLVQISEDSGSWKEAQSPESVSKHTGLALGALGAVREKSKSMQLIEELEEQRENALSMLYKVKDLVLSARAEMGELRSQVQELHTRLEEKSVLSLRLGEEKKRFEKGVEELQGQLEMRKEELERAQMQLKTERASIEELAEEADSLQAAIDITKERMSEVTNVVHVKEDEAVQLRQEVKDLKNEITRHQTTIRSSARTLESEQGRAAELETKLAETLREKEATTKDRVEKIEGQLRSSQMAAFQKVEEAGFLSEKLMVERERMRIKEEQLAECSQNWKSQKEKELRLLEQNVVESQTKINDLAKELIWERKERLRIESELVDRSKQLCEERDALAKEVAEERQKVTSLESNIMFARSNGLKDALHLSLSEAELNGKQHYESEIENSDRQSGNEGGALVQRVAEEKRQTEYETACLRQKINDLEDGFRHEKNRRDEVEGLLQERKQFLGQMVEDLQRELGKEKENASRLVNDLERMLAKELENSACNATLERSIGAERERSQFLEKSLQDSRTALEEEKSLSLKLGQQAKLEKENSVHLAGVLDSLYHREGKLEEELKTAKNELQNLNGSAAKLEQELADERNAVQALTIRVREVEIELEEKVRKAKDVHESTVFKELQGKMVIQKKEIEDIQRREAELEAALSTKELALKKQDTDLEELKTVKQQLQQLNDLKTKLEVELVNEKKTVQALLIHQQELEIEIKNLRESKDVLEGRVSYLGAKVTKLSRNAEVQKEENKAFQRREVELKAALFSNELSLKKNDDDSKEAVGQLIQRVEAVVRLTNENDMLRTKICELERRLKELEWCETVAHASEVKEMEMMQKLKDAEAEILAKEVGMGRRCNELMQALEREREKKESQNWPTIIEDLQRNVEMKDQEITQYRQLLREAEQQAGAKNAASERNDYRGSGTEENIGLADELRELREVNNRLELELKDMMAQKQAEEAARVYLEERATHAEQRNLKFEEEVKFQSERLNFAVNVKQETERQLTEKKNMITELRQELDLILEWKQQNEETLTQLRERLELEQQALFRKEEELQLVRSEIVNCKDERGKYKDETVKYKDEIVKCKNEIVKCKDETVKCQGEAAKWEKEAKIFKQKIVEVGTDMREAQESWNRKEEDGRRKTSELELMVKKLEEEVKLRQGEVTKKEQELEAVEKETAGCLEYLAKWENRVTDGNTDGKTRKKEGSTGVNEIAKANGVKALIERPEWKHSQNSTGSWLGNDQQGPKTGANGFNVKSEGEKGSEKGQESAARVQLQALWENLKEIEKSLMDKLSAVERQCVKQRGQLQLLHSNYQKSEAEVDLLNRDVEILDIILAETDYRLACYSRVLQHFPGFPEYIAKVKAVAASRFVGDPRPLN